MRSRKVPPGLLLMVPVIAGFGVYAFTTQDGGAPPGEATPSGVAAAATPTPDALLTAIAADEALYGQQTPYAAAEPEWTPVPAPQTADRRGSFHEGAWVRVNAGAGDCLNARSQPGLANDWTRVLLCLPDGFEGMLTGQASEVDGHWWWDLAGAGYVAEDYLAYVGEMDLDARTLPELAGAGLIAFVRSNRPDSGAGSGSQQVWVMDADGSDRRQVAEHAPDSADGWLWVSDLAWSPDGSVLAYNLLGGGPGGGGVSLELLVLDGSGDVVDRRSLPGVRGANWSPDSTRLGVLFDAGDGGMDGYSGVPGIAWLDGRTLRLTREPVQNERAPSFNFDGTLVLASYGQQEGETWASYRRVFDAATGAVVADVALPDDDWFASLRWSPAANLLAGYTSDGTRGVYAVYDLAAGRIVASVPVPPYSPKIGGKCGAPDMMRMEWSRDGKRVLYRFSMGDTGVNGIWTWNIATGERRLLQAGNANYPTAGPDDWFAFDTGDYIFAARSGDAFPQILAEGAGPAWWAPRAIAPEPTATVAATAIETVTPFAAGTAPAAATVTATETAVDATETATAAP